MEAWAFVIIVKLLDSYVKAHFIELVATITVKRDQSAYQA